MDGPEPNLHAHGRQGHDRRSRPASAAPSTISASPPTAPSTRPTPASAWRVSTPAATTSTRCSARIQNDLFDLGADLATPASDKPLAWEPIRIVEAQVERLEREIDVLNAELSSLRSFVLPGGTPAAAALHLARTVCRRAERLIVELSGREGEAVSPAAVKYLNRLSDFLFVASRSVNDKGALDVLWVPGQNR